VANESGTPSTVTVLFIGDVVGTAAHAMVVRMLPTLKQKYSADFIIVNGENIADGKSLKKQHAAELFAAGTHVITSRYHERQSCLGPLGRSRTAFERTTPYPACKLPTRERRLGISYRRDKRRR
jgi:hypothetical protein